MLETPRLMLRPFTGADAAAFTALAGDWEVARMTSDIPHPLGLPEAVQWLKPSVGEARFAIEYDGQLIGGAGYFPRASGAAELGFWLGRAFWGKGLATEAARVMVVHGFTAGRHAAFTSSHFGDNPASARVLAKLGFEAAGGGTIWSVARNADVTAAFYWLSRERAEILLGPFPEPRRAIRWGSLFGRLTGSART